MKKSLLISLAAISVLSLTAQTKIVWDFKTHGIFADKTGNYEFIDKYGKDVSKNELIDATKDTENYPDDPYCNQHGIPNRVISLYDGITYAITTDADWKNGTLDAPYEYIPGEEILPGEFTEEVLKPRDAEYTANVKNSPFICWMEKTPENKYYGPARIIWYPGYGSEDNWVDANYNAIDEATWIPDKGAISFIKSGQGKKPLAGTYVQFPEVQGPCKVTYYVGSTEVPLKYSVIPVVNGKAVDEKTDKINDADITAKRYYKKEYSYDGTDKVALRIMTDGCGLLIYRVEIEPNSQSGIANIAADVEDENAPVYNLMGIQVDETYKGIVIKNGKKYVQR